MAKLFCRPHNYIKTCTTKVLQLNNLPFHLSTRSGCGRYAVPIPYSLTNYGQLCAVYMQRGVQYTCRNKNKQQCVGFLTLNTRKYHYIYTPTILAKITWTLLKISIIYYLDTYTELCVNFLSYTFLLRLPTNSIVQTPG